MIFHDVEQNSEEWDLLRLGKFTASSFSSLFMSPSTLGYKKAIAKVVYDRIAGERYGHYYTSKRMEAGHDLELYAANHYEMMTFTDLCNGGFFELNEWVGCSPDRRIVGENGGVEFKSRDPHIYFEFIEKNRLPSTDKWQVHGQILCCGFDYVDYMPYCHPKLKTKILRVERDDSIIIELQEKLEESINVAKNMIRKYS